MKVALSGSSRIGALLARALVAGGASLNVVRTSEMPSSIDGDFGKWLSSASHAQFKAINTPIAGRAIARNIQIMESQGYEVCQDLGIRMSVCEISGFKYR